METAREVTERKKKNNEPVCNPLHVRPAVPYTVPFVVAARSRLFQARLRGSSDTGARFGVFRDVRLSTSYFFFFSFGRFFSVFGCLYRDHILLQLSSLLSMGAVEWLRRDRDGLVVTLCEDRNVYDLCFVVIL